MLDPIMRVGIEYKLSTVEYPNIKPGTGNDFDGYHGAKHLVDEQKAKIGAHRVASQPEPPKGETAETPAQARGAVPTRTG
jgi:hypothetical protein